MKHCCGSCAKINYTERPLNDSEAVKDHIDKNGTLLSLPIYGDMKDTTFQEYPFYPVVESPGVVFITKKEDSENSANAVMAAVFQGWPVLVLTLIMAALSGIIVWALVSMIQCVLIVVKPVNRAFGILIGYSNSKYPVLAYTKQGSNAFRARRLATPALNIRRKSPQSHSEHA